MPSHSSSSLQVIDTCKLHSAGFLSSSRFRSTPKIYKNLGYVYFLFFSFTKLWIEVYNIVLSNWKCNIQIISSFILYTIAITYRKCYLAHLIRIPSKNFKYIRVYHIYLFRLSLFSTTKRPQIESFNDREPTTRTRWRVRCVILA